MGVSWKYIAALPVLFVLYVYGLSNVGLIGPDEPRYASIGREMAFRGDYITPRLWGEPWFEKSPLLYWLIAAGFKAGLQGELAVRLPVALFSTAFLFFYFFRMRREFGEPAAAYAVLVLGTSVGWLAYSHVAVTDVLLASTFGGAVLLCLPWVRSGGRRGLAFGGVLLGLGILAKGLVPLVLAMPIFWLARKNWRDLGLFAFTAVAVAAPWYVLCWAVNGRVFLEEFIYKHHILRFVSSDLQHVQPFYFYIPVLLGLTFPWTPALWFLARRPDYKDPRARLIVAILILGFVFFSISTNKLPGYILPLLPLLAALVGIRMGAAAPSPVVFVVAAGLTGLVPIAAAVLPQALLSGLSRTSINWGMGFQVSTLILLTLCWRAERHGRRDVAAILIAFSMSWEVLRLKAFTFVEIDRVATARPVWSKIVQDGKRVPCVDNLPRTLRYGVNFYAGYELPACAGARD